MRLHTLLGIAVLCLSTLAASSSARAQTTSGESALINELTSDAVSAIIHESGFDCQKTGSGLIRFEAEGRAIYAGVAPHELFLMARYPEIRLTPEQISQFSYENDFAKLYSYEDGSTIVLFPMLLDGGVSKRNIQSAIRTFRTTVLNYVKFAQQTEAGTN